MKQKVNPAYAAIAIVALVAVAGIVLWRGFVGGAPGEQTDAATKAAIRKTTVDIPAATGAASGMTAPPPKSGGVSTPLMPSGGMSAPPNMR
jgi:hypothetical protein